MPAKDKRMPLIGEAGYEAALEEARRAGRSPATRLKRWLTHTKKDKIIERDCTIARQELELEKLLAENRALTVKNTELEQENDVLVIKTVDLSNSLDSLQQQLDKAESVSRQYLRLMEDSSRHTAEAEAPATEQQTSRLPDISALEEQARELEAQVRDLLEGETRLKDEREVLLDQLIQVKTQIPELEALRLERGSLQKQVRRLQREREQYEAYSKCLLKAQARKQMGKPAAADGFTQLCRVCDEELEEITSRPSGNDSDLRPFLGDAREATRLERLQGCFAELLEQLNDAQAVACKREARVRDLSSQLDATRQELQDKRDKIMAFKSKYPTLAQASLGDR